MGFEDEKVFGKEYKPGKFDKILRIFPSNLKQVITTSFIAGIVYFILGFAETTYYAISFSDISSETNWSDLPMNTYESYSSNTTYTIIKIISIMSFALSFYSFLCCGSGNIICF